MSSGIIPVNNSLGSSTQRIALGGASYFLTLRYNARMDRWVLDIADSNVQPLLNGLPIQGSWPLTTRFQGIVDGLPAGLLFALDSTGQARDPQEDSLGADIPLLYIEP